MATWQVILKRVISGKTHPGIKTDKTGFEALVKAEAQKRQIFVLEEGGKNLNETVFPDNSLFILGDHVGLPKKAETFALRYGQKISLGKTPYLSNFMHNHNQLHYWTSKLKITLEMLPATSLQSHALLHPLLTQHLLIRGGSSNRN
jgi:tRNA pseudouridine-54 N-methylase